MERVRSVFAECRPDVVFHAAAHKHVPLMEDSPHEAVKNNVFGTLNCARAALEFGATRFVLISTDKAVNPTNIMGASKRICEMIIQMFARHSSGTEFVATRFGNVLGSNGSVIPLFRRQIAAGGPVTLTDRRIIRYFMTIREAVQLVLTSGAFARDGELFVLDMGRPVKIIDLAESMIRLSGFEPYQDIDIVETGLRPGEKLYEELLVNKEEMTKTPNEKIFIEKDTVPSRQEIDEALAKLEKACDTCDDGEVRKTLQQIVPSYQPH
jgi:FlaA1/EpsC-like NDP-sugar epimerase